MKHLSFCAMLVGITLFWSGMAPATDACPPGQYQASPASMPGPPLCAPIPRDLQGQPMTPPSAASRWGAMAADATGTHVGTSRGLPDKQSAERAAMDQCQLLGGSPCKVAIAYGDGCASLAGGDHGYHAAADTTRELASSTALSLCEQGGDRACHVIRSDCSPAQ